MVTMMEARREFASKDIDAWHVLYVWDDVTWEDDPKRLLPADRVYAIDERAEGGSKAAAYRIVSEIAVELGRPGGEVYCWLRYASDNPDLDLTGVRHGEQIT